MSNQAAKLQPAMSKDEEIALRNGGLAKKTTNIASNNLKGTAIGYLGIHYSRNDINRYLSASTSEVIAIALRKAGLITLTKRDFDGKMVFSTVTNGKLDDERTMLPAAQVQKIVEDYCKKEKITPDGQPLKGPSAATEE